HDEGDADLAEHRVGYAEDCDLRDRRVLGQHALDLARIHVVAAADVHLAAATHEREIGARVEGPEITRRQPTVRAEDLGSPYGVPPIPPPPRLRSAADAADDTGRADPPGVGDDLELDLHSRPTDRL